jgi:hypothetical protein
MERDLRNVFSALDQMIPAIASALVQGYPLPGAVLTYSLLDSMGWLCAESGQGTNEDRFRAWIDEYLLPSDSVLCTSRELWVARCAVLHTMTGTSAKTARPEGDRRVAYAWGRKDHAVLDAALTSENGEDCGVVHLNLLTQELVLKIAKCLNRLYDDPRSRTLLLSRAPDFFAMLQGAALPELPKRNGSG